MINDIKINDKIGGKFIVKAIFGGEGKSGMGIIYVCVELESRFVIALKTFQDRFIHSVEEKESFKQEALSWIHLERHPNIVNASTYDIINDRPFIFLEFIAPDEKNRNSLEDYLTEDLSTLQILDWAIQFCYGMEHAMSRGVSPHRDIKPANIMITIDKILKITDFGLANLWNKKSLIIEDRIEYKNTGSKLTLFKGVNGVTIAGTPPWMAPENFYGVADVRSDIYSFGIVLYQLVNKGKLPFDAKNLIEWKTTHNYNEVPVLSSKIFPIISKCLQKKPENRYKDFKGLRLDLEELHNEESNEEPYSPEFIELGVDGHISKGYGFEKLNFIKEALYEYNEAKKIDSKDFLSRINLGSAFNRLHRYKDAIEEFEMAVELNPNSFGAHYNLANALSYIGEVEEAIYHYEESLKLNNKFKECHVNYGNLLRDNGKVDEAIIHYNKVLDIVPNFSKAKINLAIALDKKGDFDGAINLLEYFEKEDPKNHELYNTWGSILFDNGDDKNAIRMYIKSLTLNPDYSLSHFNLANLFFKKGEIDKAIYEFEEAIKTDPTDYLIHYVYGTLLLDENKLEGAIHEFKEVLKVNPEYREAEKSLSIAFLRKENNKDAISIFNKIIEKYPDDAELWHEKGIIHGKLDEVNESIRCFDKSLKINPKSASTFINKGISLEKLEKFEDALKCYDEALKIDSDYVEAWYYKGVIMGIMGKSDKSVEYFNKVLELNPNHCEALSLKGLELYRQKNHFESIKFIDKGINCLNKNSKANNINILPPEFKFELRITKINIEGIILAKQGEYKKAIKRFNKALKMKPQNLDSLTNKCICLSLKSDHEKAIKCFDKVLKMDPENIKILSLKGYSFNLLGDQSAAKECINNALKNDPNDEFALLAKEEIYNKKLEDIELL